MRLYVAGPMTGLPEFNFPAFHEASRLLRARGFDVLSPAEYPQSSDPGNPDFLSWEGCMRRDLIGILTDCTAIATLRDWSRSRGARLEVHVAQQLGMPVKRVDEWCWEGPPE